MGHFGAVSHGALLRNVERGEALFARLETPEYNMGGAVPSSGSTSVAQ